MFEILYQYLIQQRSLSLPGLGTLYLQNIPAMTDFSNHIISPPSDKVVFDSMLDAPQKNLFLYVAMKLRIAEWEAIKMVNDFSFDLKHQLRDGKQIYWSGIGTLKEDPSGEISLDAKPMKYGFVQAAQAKRVVRANAHHTVRRGDREFTEVFTRTDELHIEAGDQPHSSRRWWLWAAILAAIAITVLLVNIFVNGLAMSSFQNQQKPEAKEAPVTYSTSQ